MTSVYPKTTSYFEYTFSFSSDPWAHPQQHRLPAGQPATSQGSHQRTVHTRALQTPFADPIGEGGLPVLCGQVRVRGGLISVRGPEHWPIKEVRFVPSSMLLVITGRPSSGTCCLPSRSEESRRLHTGSKAVSIQGKSWSRNGHIVGLETYQLGHGCTGRQGRPGDLFIARGLDQRPDHGACDHQQGDADQPIAQETPPGEQSRTETSKKPGTVSPGSPDRPTQAARCAARCGLAGCRRPGCVFNLI